MAQDQLRTFHRNGDFVQELINHQVDFLIVGGLAVQFHRCRDVVDDLDLMLNPDKDNAQRLLQSLRILGLNVALSTENLSKANIQIPIKQDFYVDVLTPPHGIDYKALKQRSVAARLNKIPVYVVSREDLIELKLIALAQQESETAKHQTDLQRLSAE